MRKRFLRVLKFKQINFFLNFYFWIRWWITRNRYFIWKVRLIMCLIWMILRNGSPGRIRSSPLIRYRGFAARDGPGRTCHSRHVLFARQHPPRSPTPSTLTTTFNHGSLDPLFSSAPQKTQKTKPRPQGWELVFLMAQDVGGSEDWDIAIWYDLVVENRLCDLLTQIIICTSWIRFFCYYLTLHDYYK